MRTSCNLPIGYDEVYLDSARDVLGQACDWVVNTCEEDLAIFLDRFASSPVGALFERGSPKYLAGVNGAELVNAVMRSLHLAEYPFEPEFWLDKSPEYWVGWILTLYQWHTKVPFSEILKRIPASEFLRIYPLAHEMGENTVISLLDSIR